MREAYRMAIVVTSVSAPLSYRSRTSLVEFRAGTHWPYIGGATSRVDGRAKVTGEAKYAMEFPASDLANAAVIGSTIAKGRIMRIDSSQALRVASVLAVLTPWRPPPRRRRSTQNPRAFRTSTISAVMPPADAFVFRRSRSKLLA
jgi:hypothetical protein